MKQKKSKSGPPITMAFDTNGGVRSLVAQQTSLTTAKSSGHLFAMLIWLLAVLFLSNQVGCYISAPVKRATARDSQIVDYHWNCGFNVGYITLRLFHKDVDIYKLADEIKADESLDRNVSLLDLKKAFEKRCLIAEGFKADYPEDIIEFAKPGIILILHFDPVGGGQNAGHFIMIKGGCEHLVVIDPPYRPKKFAKKDIIEDTILSRASGEFLVVYEP